ncbi:hypothetical protein [Labrenzia sp. DG1229]|uniref:hypothetical protein n=1 Tax=Labrenzia sp. DG1229 TaxID=681847 RepID=UPI00056699B7|nr:hypothetical protein [Labrenzia sp. DG1229]
MQRFYEGAEDEPKVRAELIGGIIRDIFELPGRTSPDDGPDLLPVTIQELKIILRRHLFGEE